MKVSTICGEEVNVLAWTFQSFESEAKNFHYKRAFVQDKETGHKFWIATDLLQFTGDRKEKLCWFEDEAVALEFADRLHGRYRLVHMLGDVCVAYYE